jgi:hypothetical protein
MPSQRASTACSGALGRLAGVGGWASRVAGGEMVRVVGGQAPGAASGEALGAVVRCRLRLRLAGSLRRRVRLSGEAGQSTVEFAVITAAFLALALGIGALWHGFSGGMFVEHALSSASHHVGGATPQAAADMLLY